MGMGSKNSGLVAAFPVEETDDLMLITDAGQTIRVPVASVSHAGPRRPGVTVFRVDGGERVVSVERIAERPAKRHELRCAKSASGFIPARSIRSTLGHLDIIKRAVKLVDHLVIGVATNPSKAPMFTLEERVEMVKARGRTQLGRGRATIAVRAFDTCCWSNSPTGRRRGDHSRPARGVGFRI